MLEISTFQLVVFLTVGLFAVPLFLKSENLLTPAKLFFAKTAVTSLGLLIVGLSLETVITTFSVLIFALVLAYFELRYEKLGWFSAASSGSVQVAIVSNSARVQTLYFGVFLYSLGCVGALFTLVNRFGGFDFFLIALENRVVEFAGQGYLVIFVNNLAWVNALLFCTMLQNGPLKMVSKLLYASHLGVAVMSNVALGSRGASLSIIINALIIFGYFRKPVLKQHLVMAGTFTIIAVLILGAVRTDTENIDQISVADILQQTNIFSYSIISSEVFFEQSHKGLHLGSTFATSLTNFIPRGIWPEKPPTGGLVFTREYTGDLWDGSSNLSTGIMVESMMNFGYTIGFLFALLVIYLLWKLVLLQLKPRSIKNKDPLAISFRFTKYLVVLSTFSGIAIIDFGYTVSNAIIHLLLLAILVHLSRVVAWFAPGGRAAKFKF